MSDTELRKEEKPWMWGAVIPRFVAVSPEDFAEFERIKESNVRLNTAVAEASAELWRVKGLNEDLVRSLDTVTESLENILILYAERLPLHDHQNSRAVAGESREFLNRLTRTSGRG